MQDKLAELSTKFHIRKEVIELLLKRGIPEEKLARFFSSGISNFSDPFALKGLKQAVYRISNDIDNYESIVIYGDYDA